MYNVCSARLAAIGSLQDAAYSRLEDQAELLKTALRLLEMEVEVVKRNLDYANMTLQTDDQG